MKINQPKISQQVLLTGGYAHTKPKPCQYPSLKNHQWGIDTFEFSFYVGQNDYAIDSEIWESKAWVNASGEILYFHVLIYDYRGQKVRIKIDTKKGKCYISLNAAKLVHSDPLALLDPHQLSSAIYLFLKEIKVFLSSSYIWLKRNPGQPLDKKWKTQVFITRIDLARNFSISDPSFRHSLETIEHFGKTRHITEKSKLDGWSVTQQWKASGKVTLYHKTSQLAGMGISSTSGIYRLEHQIRKSRRNTLGLKTLDDINRVSTWLALEKTWSGTKWNKFMDPQSLNSVIARKFPKKSCELIGYVQMLNEGLTPVKDPKTLKNYQLMIQEAVSETLATANSQARYLDLFSGTLKLQFDESKTQTPPVNAGENSE